MEKINQDMESVFLTGEKIYLRPIKQDDINGRYLSWMNDKEVTRYMKTGVFPMTLKELQSFYDNINSSKTNIIFAIVDKARDLHIGNIKLSKLDWIHRFAELGIMIGEKDCWNKGYGREACDLVLEYAFNRLNLNKIFLGVCAEHESAVASYQKAGFKIEGRIKKLFFYEGKRSDMISMGILKEEYQEGRNES